MSNEVQGETEAETGVDVKVELEARKFARAIVQNLGPRKALLAAIDDLVMERISAYDNHQHGGTSQYAPQLCIELARATIYEALNDFSVRVPLLEWREVSAEDGKPDCWCAVPGNQLGRFEIYKVLLGQVFAFNVSYVYPGGTIAGIADTCASLDQAKGSAQTWYDKNHVSYFAPRE